MTPTFESDPARRVALLVSAEPSLCFAYKRFDEFSNSLTVYSPFIEFTISVHFCSSVARADLISTISMSHVFAKILVHLNLGSVHGILGASSGLRSRAFDFSERTVGFITCLPRY